MVQKLISSKHTGSDSIIKRFCIYMKKVFYKAMKFCEHINGEEKIINEMQNKIKKEVQDAKKVKNDLDFTEDIVISKEEHIERLYMFIGHIGVNFRNKNYDEIDRVLKKINL